MRTLRLFAISFGVAGALFGCFWILQYRSVPPVLPLLAGSTTLTIVGLWRPISRRRRVNLSLAWLAYIGMTGASIALARRGASRAELLILLVLLFVGAAACLRAVYLLTRNPRASLQNYYDRHPV